METSKLMRYILVILLAVVEGYFVACSHDQVMSPLTPEDSTEQVLAKKGSGNGGGNPSATLLQVKKRDDNENGVSTALIGPSGGVLVHGAHRVEIPAGALSQTVQVTFSMPLSDTLMFDFGPDGIQFNAPIKVILNWDHTYKSGLNQEEFKVVVWEENGQTWDEIPTTVDTELNEATGSTNHFSRYAIRK